MPGSTPRQHDLVLGVWIWFVLVSDARGFVGVSSQRFAVGISDLRSGCLMALLLNTDFRACRLIGFRITSELRPGRGRVVSSRELKEQIEGRGD